MALEPRITPMMTFTQMLRLTHENYQTTSRFNNIQQWLKKAKPKDEPVSTCMEKINVTAKRLKIGNLSEDEWIIHHFH